MIETGLPQIVPKAYGVRKYLNNVANQYNPGRTSENEQLRSDWSKMIEKCIKDKQENTLLWLEDSDLNHYRKVLQIQSTLGELRRYDEGRLFAALNNPKVHENKKLHIDWCKIIGKSIKDKNRNTLLWLEDSDLNRYLNELQIQSPLDKLRQYDTARFLAALNQLYFGDPPKDLPPKYIFSYIDNIYTVTSELSAHGKNDKTTEGLSVDGWEALLSGMLQIMKWVADTNPNPKSPQS